MQRKLVFAGACVLLLSISGLESWYVRLQRLYFYDTDDLTYLHLHRSRDMHYEVIIFCLLHLRNV